MAIDIQLKQVNADDIALKELLGRTNPKTIRLTLFGVTRVANWACSRALQRASYPFIEGQIEFHHSAFDLELGELFLFTYSKYNISQMVCRVMGMDLGDVESENITINFMEDPDYVTSQITLEEIESYPPQIDWTVDTLDPVYVLDAPYWLVGEEIKTVNLAGRVKGTEIGYVVYMTNSATGTYIQKQTYRGFCVHGTLVSAITDEYPSDMYPEDSLSIDLTVEGESALLETITFNLAVGGYNLAILYDGTNYGEVISFVTATPDSTVDGRIVLTDILRGRKDTLRRSWAAGTDFFLLSAKSIQPIQDSAMYKDVTFYFKHIPFNSKYTLDIADADEITHTIDGRAISPYPPRNLKADGQGATTIGKNYWNGSNIVLTWTSALKDEGAGWGNPDAITDAAATWEGYFQLKIYNLASPGTPISTINSINALTYDFTSPVATTDYRFTLCGYKTHTDGLVYYSEEISIDVYYNTDYAG